MKLQFAGTIKFSFSSKDTIPLRDCFTEIRKKARTQLEVIIPTLTLTTLGVDNDNEETKTEEKIHE